MKKFLEAQIFPYLPEEIKIITRGDDIFIEYPQTVVSAILHKQVDYVTFPHLIKLRDGKQIDLNLYRNF